MQRITENRANGGKEQERIHSREQDKSVSGRRQLVAEKRQLPE